MTTRRGKKGVRGQAVRKPRKTGYQYAHLPLGVRAMMTPLLEEKIRRFDLVLPRGRPLWDIVLVYPLDDRDQGEKLEGSLLYKPESTKSKFGAARGVIVKAGMGALEQLWSHGIELGHTVLFTRLSPWERKYEGKGREHKVVVLRANECRWSEELEEDFGEGVIDLEFGPDGRLRIKDRIRIDPEEGI